jgi:ABC-type phosphate transport system substrate-binding protein
VAGSAGSTSSGVPCADLQGSGTVVYVTGSSAAKPFLQQIAQQLASGGVYLVYTSTGSCVGVDAVVNATPMKTGSAPAPATSATYWESSSSTGKACDLPTAGVAADIGISDVFVPTCPGFELVDIESKSIRDAHGPIQTMTFAVPTNSPFSEISAQAAYFVFGFGAGGGVLDSSLDPIWYDEAYIFQRSATSGTQAMLASAIGVPSGSWKGKLHKTSDEVSADLQAAASSEETARKAVGILAADYIDTKNLRAQIRMLAYQDTHQPCAVSPDSTPTAKDKRNVRDGHYPIWSPLHLLYRIDQSGNPLHEENRQQVVDIIGYLSGTKPLPNGVKLLDVYAQSGLVPECAMQVKRSSDGGNVTPHRPSSPCSCAFELKATGATSCEPCDVQGDCSGATTCSQGYCEP